MFPTFHQFKPEELYLGVDNPPATTENETDNPSPEPKNGFRPTGVELLDNLLKNIYTYGLRTSEFHAYQLGIESIELWYTTLALTGMNYSQFAIKCTLMMTRDLMSRKPDDVKAVAKRLGFESYSGFYRFLKRHTKKTPTGRVVLPY